MIIVKNKILPFKGFLAMAMWPFIFVRKGLPFTDMDKNHEMIHGEQQKEVLILGAVLGVIMFLLDCGYYSLLPLMLYYIIYGIGWFIGLIKYQDSDKAYRNILFEREAYDNEGDLGYISERMPFAWIEYLRESK